MAVSTGRIELVDALRAVALFGILQVNIQSFLWGAADPLGFFLQAPRAIDTAVYLFIGTFVSLKFLSLFAFLFGLGFALQMRSLRRRHGLAGAKSHYRRRLWFLLAIGVAHGTLLYYGDILTAYAICGFVLVLYAGVRPARLVAATGWWWTVHVGLTVAFLMLAAQARRLVPLDADPRELPPDLVDNFAVMTQATFVDQLPLRLEDYLSLQSITLMTSIPFIVGLFLLGVLAGRLGLLTRPQRFARLWRWAVPIGIAGLVLSALGTWFNYQAVLHTPGDPGLLGFTLIGFGFPALALYLAWIVQRRDRPWLRAVVHWIAPAGRMPLTNYLMQSMLMQFLLTGWGLGWGLQAGRVELALLALAIVALQIVVSRWWIRRFGQGPVEALWRKVTYA